MRRHRLAEINKAQLAVNVIRRSGGKSVQWAVSANKGVVTDGVGVGFKESRLYVERLYEIPHDLTELQEGGRIKPSRLVAGCDLDKCVMINHAQSRQTLAKLVVGGATQDAWRGLKAWLEENRPELLPYVSVQVRSSHFLPSDLIIFLGQVLEICPAVLACRWRLKLPG